MTCFIPILGKRIRATPLDDCGNYPSASTPDGFVATDGFISVELSAEVEDGTEIITRKADGTLCVNELTDSSFKRFTINMQFCGVHPELLSVTSNAEIYEGYTPGEAAGIVVPEGTITKRFSLELWTGLTNQPCVEGADFTGGYFLLPFIAGGVLDTITVNGENSIDFGVTGAFTKGGNNWGVGPYDVMLDTAVPSPLPTALDPLDHLLIAMVDVAMPSSECGFQAMPS